MSTDNEIIAGCIKHDKKSQQKLYDKYSRILLGICLRYANNNAEAYDILQDSFLKIFSNIEKFSGVGSFEGWLKRITVNTASTQYTKNLKYKNHYEIDEYMTVETGATSFEEDFFTSEELFIILNELPVGYRKVFNLYAIDGYLHREIAEMLGITTTTSKSQYCRAKSMIRSKLEKIRKSEKLYSENRLCS